MVTITIGAAFESKFTTRVALSIMAFTIAIAGFKAFFDRERFDWVTPGWAQNDQKIFEQNKGKIVLMNRIMALFLWVFSIFEFYMAIFA